MSSLALFSAFATEAAGGANALAVYPPSGGTVDGGAADAPYSLAAGSVAIFWLTKTPATWKVIA
jgi:hypothetical protein